SGRLPPAQARRPKCSASRIRPQGVRRLYVTRCCPRRATSPPPSRREKLGHGRPHFPPRPHCTACPLPWLRLLGRPRIGSPSRIPSCQYSLPQRELLLSRAEAL